MFSLSVRSEDDVQPELEQIDVPLIATLPETSSLKAGEAVPTIRPPRNRGSSSGKRRVNLGYCMHN